MLTARSRSSSSLTSLSSLSLSSLSSLSLSPSLPAFRTPRFGSRDLATRRSHYCSDIKNLRRNRGVELQHPKQNQRGLSTPLSAEPLPLIFTTTSRAFMTDAMRSPPSGGAKKGNKKHSRGRSLLTSIKQSWNKATFSSQMKLINTASSNERIDFGSTGYALSFHDLPQPDRSALRNATLEYLDSFDSQEWYRDPMTTILKGVKLDLSPSSTTSDNAKDSDQNPLLVETKDAFGNVNGLQHLASPDQVEDIIASISTMGVAPLLFVKPPTSGASASSPNIDQYDLRAPLRQVEQEFLTTYAGALIGNQCLDFGKQDGVTEMEEATMANMVERRLNDVLLQQNQENRIHVNRRPIYVSCVSNFTNFLDLFRKTIRSLELGIPCIILGRTNTCQQHSYRWTCILVDLLKEHGLHHMVSFLSVSLSDIQYITSTTAAQRTTGLLYTTCSRAMAHTINSTNYANKTIASTGGPNTMVTTEWTPTLQAALRQSATIESSGQCTALRHVVCTQNTVSMTQIKKLFSDHEHGSIPNGPYAVKHNIFDGVFVHHNGTSGPPTLKDHKNVDKNGKDVGDTHEEDYYTHFEKQDVYVRINQGLHRTTDTSNKNTHHRCATMEEYWRKVVVDFSVLDHHWDSDDNELYLLAMWLNEHQPISLAMNGRREKALRLAKTLFEQTGLVVYTVGSTSASGSSRDSSPSKTKNMPPAMTCQARPQEGEIFGEFPPRNTMTSFTKFPVIVPSSTPSYDSTYTIDYLESLVSNEDITIPKPFRSFLNLVEGKMKRGYCIELYQYLKDATAINPKRGYNDANRTTLWGLQRPPIVLGPKTILRCSPDTKFDDLAPVLLLFYATNAHDQLELSIDHANHALLNTLTELLHHARRTNGMSPFKVLLQTEDEFAMRSLHRNLVYHAVHIAPMEEFPMVGQFVSLYFPMGHIKSTQCHDEEFVLRFSDSPKWLKMRL